MKWKVIIDKRLFGEYLFTHDDELGKIIIFPHGLTRVVWGYDTDADMPKSFGDYNSIAQMCLEFKINGRPFGECANEIDFIRVEYD